MAGNVEQGASVGMPQLDFSNYDNQSFWLVLFLVTVFVVVRVLVMPRMEATLTNRRKIIEEDIQEAEEFRDKALEIEKTLNVELEESRQKAGEVLRNAKDQIKQNTIDALSDIDEKIDGMVRESNKNISMIKEKADKDIQELAKKLAPEIVKAILP